MRRGMSNLGGAKRTHFLAGFIKSFWYATSTFRGRLYPPDLPAGRLADVRRIYNMRPCLFKLLYAYMPNFMMFSAASRMFLGVSSWPDCKSSRARWMALVSVCGTSIALSIREACSTCTDTSPSLFGRCPAGFGCTDGDFSRKS